MHIVPMIIDEIVNSIQVNLVDTAVPTDPARITIVKSGLLQEQKLQRRIALGVTGGDREYPNMIDGIMSMKEHPNIGWTMPTREIGGGQSWWRRGTIVFEAFLVRENLDEIGARNAAYEAMRTIVETVRATNVSHLVDSSGERALRIFVPANTMFEGGGGPTKFIFRGKILWLCATNPTTPY